MYPVPLYDPKRTGPFRPKLRRREYVYVMEENTIHKPAGNMDVILATDVEGFVKFSTSELLQSSWLNIISYFMKF